MPVPDHVSEVDARQRDSRYRGLEALVAGAVLVVVADLEIVDDQPSADQAQVEFGEGDDQTFYVLLLEKGERAVSDVGIDWQHERALQQPGPAIDRDDGEQERDNAKPADLFASDMQFHVGRLQVAPTSVATILSRSGPAAARKRRIGSSGGSRLKRNVEWCTGMTYRARRSRVIAHACSGLA